MLTIVRKSKIEKLQAQLTSARLDSSNYSDEVRLLKKENKILREANARLFEKTASARKRDAKGHFLPKN